MANVKSQFSLSARSLIFSSLIGVLSAVAGALLLSPHSIASLVTAATFELGGTVPSQQEVLSNQKAGVTVYPSAILPREAQHYGSAATPAELLRRAAPGDFSWCAAMIQTSFNDIKQHTDVYIQPKSNGFVHAAIEAYSNHHHLIIRPEDVWFAILTQLSFYINKHAEELREFFVAHDGKKQLRVETVGTIADVDFGFMAYKMGKLLGQNVRDPSLKTWIMPNFTTSTRTDEVVASVLFMGAMQAYFDYAIFLTCGLPSVTLLGTRADWQDVHDRLVWIPQLGEEAAQFHKLLEPVVGHFVRTFDDATSAYVKNFWNRIADRRDLGSGMPLLSGWITAFCFWDGDGNMLWDQSRTGTDRVAMEEFDGNTNGIHASRPYDAGVEGQWDASLYHDVDWSEIPTGIASVPVLLNDNGVEYNTTMVAGSFGYRITQSGSPAEKGHTKQGKRPVMVKGLDSFQPESGWYMFINNPDGGASEEEGLNENSCTPIQRPS